MPPTTRTPLPKTASFTRRSATGAAVCRRASALLLLPLTAVAGAAQAIGLGEITQQSGLGQPLRIVVPIIAGAGEEISGECFRLAPTQRSADGIPEVLTARITLERTSAGARLVVTTLRPLAEPVVKVTLQAGCANAIRREYTLFLDPLPIETPVAAEAAAPVADTAVRRPADTEAGGDAETRSTAPVPTVAVAPSAPERHRSTAAAPRVAGTAPPESRPRPAPATRTPRKAALAAAPQPRPKLTVSTAAPGRGPPDTDASDATAAQRQELAATLEAETIVLRQRVAELTATVDRMQQEIVAAQALQAARIAAENAAKEASPQATMNRWWNDGWPFVAVVIGLAALIATGLSLRRRRAFARGRDRRLDAPPAERAAPPALPAPQGPDSRGSPTAMAVSELSHVTEEAGVYLALNRVDRAIEVLQQHIRTAQGSLPAAWMMLLDLYRSHDRGQDFRELAQEFHRRFNAATPSWDTFPHHDDGDRGLEAFPHVVQQLVAAWGTPECRALLDRLLHDNRDGRRTGFSLRAYEDIILLRQLVEPSGGDAGATGAARRDPRPAAAATGSVAQSKLPLALDLELELDKDMLDSARPPRPSATTPTRGKP